jgi:hypothetical protein
MVACISLYGPHGPTSFPCVGGGWLDQDAPPRTAALQEIRASRLGLSSRPVGTSSERRATSYSDARFLRNAVVQEAAAP